MKFLGNGSSAVWDKEKSKTIDFVDGIYETDDSRIANILKTAGCEYEGEIEEIEEVKEEVQPKKKSKKGGEQ